jgi:hypothetical protein
MLFLIILSFWCFYALFPVRDVHQYELCSSEFQVAYCRNSKGKLPIQPPKSVSAKVLKYECYISTVLFLA